MSSLHIYSSLIAFLGCFFSAISGGGAGFITLPLFLLIGLPFPNALAIHKLATTSIGIGSLLRLRGKQFVDSELFWKTGFIACPFVALGTLFSERVPADLLRPILGGFILCCLVLSYKNRQRQMEYSPKQMSSRERVLFWLLVCLLGFYNGLLSAGAGVFLVLVYVWLLGYDQLRANALMLTSAALFWNGVSLLTHIYLQHVIWSIVPLVFLASIVGSYLGMSLSVRQGNSFLYRTFLLTSIVTALLLILR